MKKFFKNNEYQHYRIFAVVVILLFSITIYNIWRAKYNEDALKVSMKTWAVISEMNHATSKIPGSIDFFFYNAKGEKIEILNSDPIDCFNFRKEKDTIFIKYSLTDNYVAEILHCFWNGKLKDEMNK